jgi:hypothetical protein
MRKLLLIAGALSAVAACGTWSSVASAGSVPVTGGVFTSVNGAVDGPGRCLNGNPEVNCNLYTGKPYVWLNGGPSKNGLGPNGLYFFAVLAPGGQPEPNDGGARNLSDDFDSYTNRTFSVTNGEVSAYGGTHDYHAAADKIRLYPFADTPNPGGVYIMAVCYIGLTGTSYPVDPRSCKYDAFKAPFLDDTPPVCVLTASGTNSAGAKYIQVTVQDPNGPSDSGSGIETIVIDEVNNATLTYSPDPWYVGTMSPVTITATKDNPAASSFLKLTVTNVAGLATTCDPEVPAVRKAVELRKITRPWLPNRRGGV